jgi:nitrogen regulatory protein A
MKTGHQRTAERLACVRRITESDVVALAYVQRQSGSTHWFLASGNKSDRYKRIVLRAGKGLAGKVISSGRPYCIDSYSPKRGTDPAEYPIMLAESLAAALVVPIVGENCILGVLLIGQRTPRTFSPDLIAQVEQVAGLFQADVERKE